MGNVVPEVSAKRGRDDERVVDNENMEILCSGMMAMTGLKHEVGRMEQFDVQDLDEMQQMWEATSRSKEAVVLAAKQRSERRGAFGLRIPTEFFDPRYDCDFRSGWDQDGGYRGRFKYTRPIGGFRMALYVQYNDNGTWFAADQSGWPVSYHGTAKGVPPSILKHGFKVGPGAAFGPGIYSSPSPDVAKSYATPFSHRDKQYKLVFQNRINPVKLKVVVDTPGQEYWLIPQDELDKTDLRPYGIVIFEV